MNLSGNAVGPLMAFYKIPLENLIVIHDEMDLPIGKMREKIGGGSAGHNGIKSIDRAVGNEYRRIRIGIGHPRELGLAMSPADWVWENLPTRKCRNVGKVIDDINLFLAAAAIVNFVSSRQCKAAIVVTKACCIFFDALFGTAVCLSAIRLYKTVGNCCCPWFRCRAHRTFFATRVLFIRMIIACVCWGASS